MIPLRRASAFAALALLLSCAEGPTTPPTPVANVSITGAPVDAVLLVGAATDLAAVATDGSGGALARTIAWSSSTPAVATVNGDGVVTGLSAGGTLIVAAAGGVADTLLLSVRVPVPATPAGAPAAVTTTVLGGAVELTVPPGATAAAQLTVAPAAVLPDDDRLLAGSAFDFGPSGATFSTPLTMSLRYDAATVPPAKRSRLRIHRVEDDGTLTMLDGGSVDEANARVSAPVSSFSTYAIVVPPDVASITVVDGNQQAAHVGASVQGLAVRVADAQQRPVPLVQVTFSLQGGGGSLQGATTATTDANGIATLPGSWTMGPTKGVQTLRATIVGDGRFVTFTATATAPAVGLRVAIAPSSGTSGVVLDPIVVQVVDVFGDQVLEIGRQVSIAVASGTGTLAGTTVMDAPTGGAIFQALSIAGAGPHRLVVTSTGLTPDTTDAIDVAQELGGLAIITPPGGAVSGQPFATQPVVELRDHAGLRLVGSTLTVTASEVHGPGVPYGGLTATAVDGVATFSGLAIEGEGAQRLRFSAGFYSVISDEFTVAPPPPGVWLRLGLAPTVNLNPGQAYGPDLLFDLSNSGGADLATVQVTVTWDTTMFSYLSATPLPWMDGSGGNASVTVDETQVSGGILVVNGQSPNATTASFALARILLQARSIATTATTVVGVTVNVAQSATPAAVPVSVRPLTATIIVP